MGWCVMLEQLGFRRMSLHNRLMMYIDKRGPDECWEWFGTVDRSGYGRIKIARKCKLSHRVMWEIENGEIPLGEDGRALFVCHHCDNPPCCNPRHMFLGTAADNSHDMVSKGRSQRNRRNGNAKLTESEVIEIRSNPQVSGRVWEAKFGITSGSVSKIKSGQTWKALGGAKRLGP